MSTSFSTSLEPGRREVDRKRGGIEVVDLDVDAKLDCARLGLDFLGPTIRGGFGYALRRIARPERVDHDVEKPTAPDAFGVIFEGAPPTGRDVMRRYDTVPQPFALRVAAPGSWNGKPHQLRFAIRLFGNAARWIPEVTAAIEQLGSDGIGRDRIRFEVDSMTLRPVMRNNAWQTEVRSEARIKPEDGVLRWRFRTPVQFSKTPARTEIETLTPLKMILAGRRRWHLMTSLFGTPSEGAEHRLEHSDFHFVSKSLQTWSISRFSGRQKRAIPLTGLVGEVLIKGPWSRAGHWVDAIEHLHLGKHVSFGLGHVEWDQIG